MIFLGCVAGTTIFFGLVVVLDRCFEKILCPFYVGPLSDVGKHRIQSKSLGE